MPENRKSRWMRWGFWLFPSYLGTGARVTYIDGTYKELRVRLPLSWRTRNYVGSIYGGSIYASVDPMYMLMLMKILGSDYVVWDKAATIRFKKPGRETLYANFTVSDEQIAEIKQRVAEKGETDYLFQLAMTDKNGVPHVEFDKTLYVATKAHYKQKLERRKQQ